MAGLGVTLLILWLLRPVAALEVSAPSPQRVLRGSSVILTCTFSQVPQPLNLNFLAVTWRFHEKTVLSYHGNQYSASDPRMSLRVQALQAGDASLHLTNTKISDGGIYTCDVTYTPERREREISLHVQARPLISISQRSIQTNQELTLTCLATGFYPPDIAITWSQDGEILKNQSMGRPEKSKDGTYQVTSIVTVTPTDANQNKTFSCHVQHATLPDHFQEDFHLHLTETRATEEPGPANHQTAEKSSGAAIVGSLVPVMVIVAAAIAFLWWHLKHKGKGTFLLADIEGPIKLMAGEEVTLHCSASDCPENMRVTWLEDRGGLTSEIRNPGDPEDEEKLLGAEYNVTTQREGPSCSSTLTFRPSVTKHQDLTLICRYSYRKKTQERTFHCQVYAKPELTPVMRSLSAPGEIKYSITVERFFPRKISIKWICGMGETQKTNPSTEKETQNPDGTYSICSEVTIPENQLKEPEFRARVSWEHEALDTEEFRDFSIRDADYPWRPEVGEIRTPRLFHGTPVTLRCEISQYFPGDVTVTWMRRDKESEELEKETVISGGPTQRREDNTYSCTATLTIIPTLLLHQGAAYICRVQHPSLQTPIERSTGELQVTAKPELTQSVKRNLSIDGEMKFSITLEKFYPSKITVRWTWGEAETKEIKSSTGAVTKSPDGTYSIYSVVRIPENLLKNPEFRAQVSWEHEALDTLEYRDFSIRDADYPWLPLVGEIQTPRIFLGTPVTLQCDISQYFPGDVTVTWLRRDKESEELEEETVISGGPTRRREADNTYSCTATLTFTPSLLLHQGAAYICRVQHPSLQTPIERSTGELALRAKPELTQPVMRSLSAPGEMRYSIILEKFYPNEIAIQWTCGAGEIQETKPSIETVTQSPNGTYSVCSEVTIPENLLKEPEFRARVRWEHEALDTPGYRELSIRDKDYPWCPLVGEIRTPRLFHGTPVTLQCDISRYFPGDVTVTWLRRDRGSEELVEDSEDETTRAITERRGEENTYSSTAALTITPKLDLHQGAAYICRVQHPSLQTPIERSTGELAIQAKPQVQYTVITMSEDCVKFTFCLHKLYPKDITITWRYEAEGRTLPRSSSEDFSHKTDQTYQVTSDALIPVSEFTDPGFKVYVSWNHPSMEEEESRSMSARDLPWKPHVGDIVVPKLKENKSATLTCYTLDYFPDLLRVRWFKNNKTKTDSKSLETPPANETYRDRNNKKKEDDIPEPPMLPLPFGTYKVNDKKEKNKDLFSLESFLTFPPSVSTDQGAEFICRVEHPSLEGPIEKTTGPVTIHD